MILSDILNELRDVYGLDQTTYPDTTLETLIEKARKKISELFPYPELDKLTTVKDQTRYTVSKTGMLKLKQVFYRQGYQTNMELFGDADVKSSFSNSNSTFFPSQSFEFIQRMKLLRDMFPIDAEIVDECRFDLIPTPQETGEIVYFEYLRYRTLAEIPEMFMDDLCQLVIYYYGEKPAQKALLNPQGNKYQFDRRGNTSVSENTHEIMQRSRKVQLDAIITTIKNKVSSM